MSNWRLRTKLFVVLLIPSLAAVVLGALRVGVDFQNTNTLERNSEQVAMDTRAATVVHELQRERDFTAVYLASNRTSDRSELDRQRGAVDVAVSDFQAEIARVRDGMHPEGANRFSGTATHLDRLQSLRAVADGSAYPPDASFRAYADSVTSLLELGEQGITSINNPDLVRRYLATNAMARVKEQESTKRALLGDALQRGSFQPDGYRTLLGADAELDAALNDFRKWASPEQVQTYDDTVAGQSVDRARTIEATALVRAEGNQQLGDMPVRDWMNVSTETVNLTSTVDNQLRGELKSTVDGMASVARTQMYIAIGLILGALALAFAIALMVARSLLVPLRTLRRSALDVADKRLPDAVDSILRDPSPDVAARARVEPIPVHTREEIGRVARSFDAVHSQALRLASEQALLRNNINDLFVNLARRSQTLVQRQLSLIDRLEQDEQDPDQLGSLFELDHLATRMRRNNENLLILGGTDLTRRMMRPVPLSEVIGAAVSEVEQYARIVVADAPELAIQGRVVNDFVHLVAELLENATVFSNPDTDVTVRTAYRRHELVLEIRDRGVGIDESEVDDINERLTRPPEVDVAISRRMGLFVVGQLARRHNIRVHLQNNADLEGGVTATVHLSGDYIAQLTPDGQPMPMPDAPAASTFPPGPSTDEHRDSVTESGTHAGLAAAFGRGTDRTALPTRNRGAALEDPNGFMPQPRPSQDDSSRGDDSRVDTGDTGVPPNYSIQVAASDSFGVSDVPKWEQEEPRQTRDDTGVNAWPGSGSTVDTGGSSFYEGQCGLPEMDGKTDLFHSPFEAEKTANFTPPPPFGDWLPNNNRTGLEPTSGDAGFRASGDNEVEGQPPAVAYDSQPKGAARDMDDAPTERLPIYEAVLSQWFRESDVDESARPGSRAALGDPDFGFEPAGLSGSNGGSDQTPASSALGSRDAGSTSDDAAEANGVPGEPAGREEVFAGSSTGNGANRPPEDPGWGSADAGWQAAEALVQQSEVQETTSAGLPKRVPKSNLVPGSAAPRAQSSAPTKPSTPRSADAVRGRMSNFQQGIRRGRHAKAEPVSTEQPRSIPSRHEEQE
jgi:signal transduction histidine kinase